MNQCLKITLFVGAVKGLGDFVQKHAKKLELEGVVQLISDDHVKIIVCGLKENMDEFVDTLYKGSDKYKLDNIEMEPYFKEKGYRGVFRVIM